MDGPIIALCVIFLIVLSVLVWLFFQSATLKRLDRLIAINEELLKRIGKE